MSVAFKHLMHWRKASFINILCISMAYILCMFSNLGIFDLLPFRNDCMDIKVDDSLKIYLGTSVNNEPVNLYILPASKVVRSTQLC
jgi:hypothetical protein